MWLGRHVHAVVHGTTKERPAERLVIERPVLSALPQIRFDTALRDTRRVGRVPLVEWDTVFYSAPPELAGKLVEVRQPVGYDVVELRFLGRLEAIHQLAPKGSEPQWLPEHKAAAERVVLGRRRLQVLDDAASTSQATARSLELEDGDYDVAVPDLAVMGAIGPHPDIDPPVDIASEGPTADGFDLFGGGS